MFGDQKYLHDNTFRRVVDAMRSILSTYVTPGELREAVILAATMHESENIRPMYVILKDEFLISDYLKSPAMFGGICSTDRTASGATTGRIPSEGSTVKKVDKYKCICMTTWQQNHSQTCKDYNWSVTHPSRLTEHVYGEWHKGMGKDNEWRMCVRCKLSSTYIEFSKTVTCMATERRKAERRVAVSDIKSNKRGCYTRGGKDRRTKS
jgi:hypothetical protein